MAVPTAFLPLAAENAQLERYRNIDRQLMAAATDSRAIDRSRRLQRRYAKYPWLSPGIAVAFTKWEEQYGTQAARGLARSAFDASQQEGATPHSVSDQLEHFIATKDFQSQVKDYRTNGGAASWWKSVKDDPSASPALKKQAFKTLTGQMFDSEASFSDAVGGIPAVGPTIKGASRAAFTALESPYQEVQALGSSLAGHVTEAFGGAAQSVGSGRAPSATPSIQAGALPDSGLELGPYHPGTSTGAIALDKLLSGDRVDLGTGYFPGGEVAKEHTQQVRDIASLTYGGQRHFATPGRIFAATVTEPGTDPFNALSGLVDAATIIKADPANIALTKLGEVNEARKGFAAATDIEKAGGFTSWVRHFVDPPTVDQYLASKEGAALKTYLAGTKPEDLAELGRRTNWKWGADTYAKVIAAQTPEDIDAALRPALGLTIDRQPALKSFAASVRNTAQQVPMLTEIPGTRLDISNAGLSGQNGSLRALYNHALGLGLDDAQISRHLNDIIGASGNVGRSEGLVHFMAMEKAGLVAKGVPEEVATKLTRFAREDLTGNARRYFDVQMARGAHIPGVMIDETMFPLEKPYLISEHLGDHIFLTPLQGKGGRNEALWKYGRVLGIPGTSLNENLDDFGEMLPGVQSKLSAGGRAIKDAAWKSNAFAVNMQNRIWKPLQLIRGAWMIRVLGEEQLRMGMAGYDNIFTHPISYMAFLAKKKEGAFADTLDWANEMGGLRNSQAGAFGLLSPGDKEAVGRIVGRNTGTFTPEMASHAEVWANKLAQYSEDPMMQRVARAVTEDASLNDLKDSFFDGQLRTFRHDLANDPNFVDNGIDLATREGADRYIDGLYDRLHYYTGGDGDLIGTVASQQYKPNLEAVARRSSLKGQMATYDGEPVEIVAHRRGSKQATILMNDGNDQRIALSQLDVQGDAGSVKLLTKNRDGVALDKEFVNHLRSLPDEIKPAEVSGVHNVREGVHADSFVNWAFANMMDKPTSYLNRSTVFAQEYEKQMERLRPFIASGEATAAEADQVAKGHALDTLRELLYDTHRRNRGLAAIQLLVPFGEAWKEMFGSWAKIIAHRPQTIRKFQVGVTAAQQANPFALLPGAVPGAYGDKGFFFKDPNNNGEEMFVYPWSAALNDKLIGVPLPFTGQAQSLNIGFNLFPGVGPAFQVPGMWFLNRYMNDKKWDPIRHLLQPYGGPDLESGALEQIGLPAWARKFLLAGTASPNSNTQSARALNSTIGDILAYRASTGEFNPNDKAGVEQAYKRAEKDARWLYAFRGAFQWTAPAAPTPQFLADSKNKNLTQFWVLSKALHKLYDDDPNTAVAKFIDRFGERAMYATSPKTLGATFGSEYTAKAWDWQRDNKSIVDKYPLSWAEFVPRNTGDDFSPDAYQAAISRGDTEAIPAKERALRTNNVLGAMWYDRVREKMGLGPGAAGTKQQQLYLADVRNQIHKAYPGWRQVLTDDSRVPRAVEELVAASKDRAVKKSNPALATALNAYVTERQWALGEVKRQGGGGDFSRPGFSSGKKWRYLRDYLRDAADQITTKYPQFGPLFQDTFDREMQEDN